MSLNDRQTEATRTELHTALQRTVMSADDVAADLGWDPTRATSALTPCGADPADAWLVRDLLDRRVHEAGADPIAWSTLTQDKRAAADGWFGLQDLDAVLRHP